MGKVFRFEVPGKPQGKARPRLGRGHTYTPQKTTEYEMLVRNAYLKAGGKLVNGPVEVHVVALFEPPKSVSKKERQAMLRGEIPYTKRPDKDNIDKVIFDALNGVAYPDDSYIVGGSSYKYYAESEKVIVIICDGDSSSSRKGNANDD